MIILRFEPDACHVLPTIVQIDLPEIPWYERNYPAYHFQSPAGNRLFNLIYLECKKRTVG